MPNDVWKSPADRDASPLATRDEFGPDVAAAIADLRERHGLDEPSCQPEGHDRLRSELAAMLPGVNRRGFLRLTGAAAVFALAACNEKHPDTLVPYAVQPEGSTIGNATWYSTVVRDAGQPVAVMAKSYDGRPIKIDGNPDCPVGRGRADARTQAALLNLYDPDRFQAGPQKRDGVALAPTTWDAADAAIGTALKSGAVGLLTGPLDGLAHRRLLADLKAALGDRLVHAEFSALSRVTESTARATAFGDGRIPAYRLDRASVLVTLGSDILGNGSTGLGEHVGFGELRRLKDQGFGQVIAFEPTMSQVGTCADVRVRVSFDRLAHVGWAIAEVVASKLGKAIPAGAKAALDQVRGTDLDAALGLKAIQVDGHPQSSIVFAAERLLAAKAAGRNSLVYAGGVAHENGGAPLLLAAHWLNAALGNEGVTTEVAPGTVLAESGQAAALLADCASGRIGTLIIWGADPVFALPGAETAIAKVPVVVALADRLDDTARLAHWILPSQHALESWGDAEIRQSVFALQQPVITALWDNRSAEESLMAAVLAAGLSAPSFAVAKVAVASAKSVVTRTDLWHPLAHGVKPWRDYVKAVWLGELKPRTGSLASDVAFWNSALATGVIDLQVAAPTPVFDGAAIEQALSRGLPSKISSGYQLVLSASRVLRDGASANNPWLNELPDPVSKITWNSYLAVSPKDAEEQGWAENDVVAVTVAGAKPIELPVHIQEGQHPGTLEAFYGWGRIAAGEVAAIEVHTGFSVNLFRLGLGSHGRTAVVAKTGATFELANVQGHHRMDGRPIAQDDLFHETHHAHWQAGTDGKPAGRLNLWGSSAATLGHKWGLTVDLNACTGCNACVIACSAENNVPVVGRDEVRKNREMHWIRIDRYYAGADALDVDVVQQPVMCQHCDNAPCESVCPANATMHNNEGVNLQVYNRCIGTRYCANNCPYKVRRFNWYEYSQLRSGPQGAGEPLERVKRNIITSGSINAREEMSHAPLNLLLNPDVIVRSKGVMEKCTFCVQRTRQIRDTEKASGKAMADGTITSACAQTCPTKALTFGDINDPFSQVTQVTKAGEAAGLAYGLLDADLNTRPAVTYLKRLRKRPATGSHEAVKPHQGDHA